MAHLLRDLTDAGSLGVEQEAWTTQAARALREAITAVSTARAQGIKGPQADAALGARLARSRWEYDAATAVGASINLSRPWAGRGNHPALVLATRLARKAAQVWLFTTRFDVPATNNGSETAIRGAKIAQKVSGCWRHLQGLARYARIRSYLETTRTHHVQAITAIRDALTGNPWMPHTA